MSGDKVKFHTLERLDIVDVNALQDLAHQEIVDAVGALLSGRQASSALNNTQGGLLQDFTFTTNNVTNTLTPSDLLFVAPRGNPEISTANSFMVGMYNSGEAGNSVVSFASSKSAAQTYYNANGTLPPAPGSASYVAGTHGAAYPKIYARIAPSEAVLDTRRFWDVANAVEESRSVNTRILQRVSFNTIADGSNPPAIAASAEGSDWVLIGQISGWSLSGGTVNVPASLIKHFYADFLMPLDASDPYLKISSHDELAVNLIATVRGGGIPAVIDLLKGRLNRMKNAGSLDSDIPAAYSVATGTLAYPPRYSLDGLAGAVRTLRAMHRSANVSIRRAAYSSGSAKITSLSDAMTHSSTGGFVRTAFDSTPPTDMGEFFIPLTVHRDFTLYKELGFTLNSGDVGAVSANTPLALSAYVAGYFIEIPEEYAGWGVRVSVQPLHQEAYAGYTPRLAKPVLYVKDSDVAYSLHRVSQLSYVTAANQNITAYGFRVITMTATNRMQDVSAYDQFIEAGVITATTERGWSFGFELALDLFPVSGFTIVDTPN